MTDDLRKKVDRAIRLLQSIKADEIELSYSGGKDSDVILELAKMAGIKFRAIYKNTTIDPPGTIKHVIEQGVEIIRPSKTFAQIIRYAGYPDMFRRLCCRLLKEYKVLDKAIHGIRRSESVKRAKRYKEPTYCRVYGKERVEVFMPILEWNDKDVKDFVETFNVKCHPLYYDENGGFHPERRLGCMCCPLASQSKRIEQFKQYPNMVKFYIRNGGVYLESHPKSPLNRKYRDEYEWFTQHLFCKSYEEFLLKFDGLFGRTDCKKFLEAYFNIKL